MAQTLQQFTILFSFCFVLTMSLKNSSYTRKKIKAVPSSESTMHCNAAFPFQNERCKKHFKSQQFLMIHVQQRK